MGEHYVPRKYLSAFSAKGDPDLIWMYDRRGRDWSKAAILKVAQERNFYGVETEKQLNEIVERPGNRALEKLRSLQKIEPDERENLALYVATTIGRVPKRRSATIKLLPKAAEETLAEVGSLIESQAASCSDGDQAETMRAAFRRASEAVRADPMKGPVRALLRSPWVSARILQCIREMTWLVLRAPKSERFVTSDNPAFYFDSLGLGLPNSEFSFPVSPDVAIHGFWRRASNGKTLYKGARVQVVKEFNRRTIFGAERFVFSGSREEWIEKVAENERPHLSVINWTDIP